MKKIFTLEMFKIIRQMVVTKMSNHREFRSIHCSSNKIEYY